MGATHCDYDGHSVPDWILEYQERRRESTRRYLWEMMNEDRMRERMTRERMREEMRKEMRKEKTRDLSPKVSWDGSRMKTSPTGIAVPEKSWGGGSMVALIAEMRCGLSLAPPEDIWVQDPLPEESCGGGSMMELPASISVPKVSQDFPPKKPWAGLRLVKLRETLDTYKTVIAHFNEL